MTQPRRGTAALAQHPGVCRKLVVSVVSMTRPGLPPCGNSSLQVCEPSISPDGLRASSLSHVNCGCSRLDMQLHPQDKMIVCSESLPHRRILAGCLGWRLIRCIMAFLEIRIKDRQNAFHHFVKNPADATIRNTASYFLFLNQNMIISGGNLRVLSAGAN